MKRKAEKKFPMTEINITPFTDVVLVLLIIFIVVTPMLSQNRVKIMLPKASQEQNEVKPKKIIVFVNEKGDISLKGKLVPASTDYEALKSAIINSLAHPAGVSVVIHGDKNCRYETIMNVVSAAKEAGARSVLLASDKKQ